MAILCDGRGSGMVAELEHEKGGQSQRANIDYKLVKNQCAKAMKKMWGD